MLVNHPRMPAYHAKCVEEKCPSGGVVSTGMMVCFGLYSPKPGAPVPQRIHAAHVRILKSDDIATSPFAAGTGYWDEPTGDGYGHDGR
jgi:hypothetical protein